VMMPIQDGWEVLRELRKFSKSVPVLMLSAQASTDDFARSEELGATRFLKKPFDPAQLALVVREMTSQSENTPTDVLDLSEAREEFIDSFDSRRKSLIASLASLSTLEEDLQSGASKVSCKVSFEVKMIAHNIAGISGSYGFSALGSIAAEIDEHLVDEVSVSKLIACCERLDQALEYCIRSRQDCGEDCFTSSEESPASEATP
jgi:CheY-like chemotaxis protein